VTGGWREFVGTVISTDALVLIGQFGNPVTRWRLVQAAFSAAMLTWGACLLTGAQ
jgi:hypothetical protein